MEEFIKFVDGMIEEFKMQEQELLNSGCKDEANFAKIKMNICDICKTLYNTSLKKVSAMKPAARNVGDCSSDCGKKLSRECGGEWSKEVDAEFVEKLREDYLGYLTRIPENWKASYEKAKEHEDTEKLVIEEIKLEVLQTIKDKFEELTCK